MVVSRSTTSNETNAFGRIRKLSMLYGSVLAISTLVILFYYNEFQTFVLNIMPGESEVFAYVLSAVFVTSGVLALPYLLGMRLSSPLRQVSRACGFVAPLTAGVIGISMTLQPSTNYAILPENIIGTWILCVSVALLLLAVWISWGKSSSAQA